MRESSRSAARVSPANALSSITWKTRWPASAPSSSSATEPRLTALRGRPGPPRLPFTNCPLLPRSLLSSDMPYSCWCDCDANIGAFPEIDDYGRYWRYVVGLLETDALGRSWNLTSRGLSPDKISN